MTNESRGSLASAFADVAARNDWKLTVDPWNSCEAWAEFTKECLNGYGMDYSEYIHDSLIRDLLELALQDEAAKRTPEFGEFASRIQRTDKVFRELIANGPVVRPEEPRWWRRSLPPSGEAEFVNDVKERLGILLRRPQ